MIIPRIIGRRFEESADAVAHVAERVKDIVLAHCETSGFAYVGRIKAIDSLAEKIETGRFRSWSDLDDLFACTIVIPTLSHENDSLAFLADSFVEVGTRLRANTEKAPDVFRFEATRFYGRLKVPIGLDPNDAAFRVKFEVQIRTAFEHAWSATTHAIYKSDRIDWRVKRIGAQLKAAVEQLDLLVLGFEEAAEGVVGHRHLEVDLQCRLLEAMSTLADDVLPDELRPKDWSRSAENVYAMLKGSAEWPKGRPQCERFVEDAIAMVSAEMRGLGRDRIPRSLSLSQLVLGVVSREGLITALPRYHPILSDELEMLYPEVARFRGNEFRADQ